MIKKLERIDVNLVKKINEQRPTKIIWEYPDTVEMTDKDGNIHTYSIIELLDGLQRITRAEQITALEQKDK